MASGRNCWQPRCWPRRLQVVVASSKLYGGMEVMGIVVIVIVIVVVVVVVVNGDVEVIMRVYHS